MRGEGGFRFPQVLSLRESHGIWGETGGGAFKVGPKVRGKGGGKGKGGREPAMGSRPEVRVSACGTGRGPGVGEGKGALV